MKDLSVSAPARPTPELDAVVGYVNTLDELDSPRDRLTSISVVHAVLARFGLETLGVGLTSRHLGAARRLRDDVRSVFLAGDEAAAAEIVNGLLTKAKAQPIVAAHGDGWRITLRSPLRGVGPLTAAFAGALADVLASGSGDRLGVCAGHPCQCVYVDATRSARQRFCCELCNDRAASAAYRRRRSSRATSR